MRRAPFIAGLAALAAAWGIAAAGAGMTGHMAAHMAAIAVAAPLIAWGIAGTRADPAMRTPLIVAPLPMAVVELIVVWGWHLPAMRAFAARGASGLMLEQATFLARETDDSVRRAAGVLALLVTTMHMTLLGVLIALASRPLFATAGFTCLGVTLPPLLDQHLGGVVMLLVGAGSYLLGGLALLSRLLRHGYPGTGRPWS